MSDATPPPQGDPSDTAHQPNWGSAYPPPAAGGYPPPQGYPTQGYQQPGYQQPGYYPYGGLPPKHHSATTAMVLGIVAVGGGLMCWLPLFVSPFAWVTGSRAIRDIDASNGTQSGRGEAMAGKVLGIIGTVLLVLALAVVVLLVVLTFTVDDFWDDDSGYYDSTLAPLVSASTMPSSNAVSAVSSAV